MSDAKAKRTARDRVRGETAPIEVPADEPTPATAAVALTTGLQEPEAVAAPEVVSAPAAVPATGPAPVASPPPPQQPEQAADVADDAWAALAEAQSALARGFEAFATQVAGMTRSGIANTTEAAVALIGARTLAEAIEINAGLVRRGVDTAIEGSAKLSEISVTTATEASRPILSRLGAAWSAGAP